MFVLKVKINFRELIRKKWGRVCVKGVWHDLFHGRDIDYNVMSQKIVYIVVSGCNWSEEGLRGK